MVKMWKEEIADVFALRLVQDLASYRTEILCNRVYVNCIISVDSLLSAAASALMSISDHSHMLDCLRGAAVELTNLLVRLRGVSARLRVVKRHS